MVNDWLQFWKQKYCNKTPITLYISSPQGCCFFEMVVGWLDKDLQGFMEKNKSRIMTVSLSMTEKVNIVSHNTQTGCIQA